jgi:hypothetical protein
MAILNQNLDVKKKTCEFVTDHEVIYHQNIRSVNGKIDELLSYWSNVYPHVLCLMEHRLHNQEISKLYSSPLYTGSQVL